MHFIQIMMPMSSTSLVLCIIFSVAGSISDKRYLWEMPSTGLGSMSATSAAVFFGSSTSFMKGNARTSLME
jgi:hypothetical protein